MPKLEMTVHWVVETPLNIAGAPADNPLADTPLLRHYACYSSTPKILLPASTIKGKLRGEAERLLRTFGFGDCLCHGRTPETMCPALWWDHKSSNMPPGGVCMLCRLFGSPWQPAPLFFRDAMPDQIRSEDTVVRPGVGLSRVRGTSQEDLLFFVETTPPIKEGIEFVYGRIEGSVPDAESAALLWLAAQQVIAFGNGRSRGRGWLKTRQRKVEVKINNEVWFKAKLEEVLRNWLKLPEAGEREVQSG